MNRKRTIVALMLPWILQAPDKAARAWRWPALIDRPGCAKRALQLAPWLVVSESMAAKIWTDSCWFSVQSTFTSGSQVTACEEGNRAPPTWRSCHVFTRRPSRSLARSRHAPTRPRAQSAQTPSKGTQKERHSCEPRRISQTATGEKLFS